MLSERSLSELYRPAAAGERAAAVASVAERRRTAAALLGSGKTQVAVAEALGVSDRTIRNWKQAPSFQRDLERARERAHRQAREAWERFQAHNPQLLASMPGRRQPRPRARAVAAAADTRGRDAPRPRRSNPTRKTLFPVEVSQNRSADSADKLAAGAPARARAGRRSPDSALLDLVTLQLGWLVCLGEPGAGNQTTRHRGRPYPVRARPSESHDQPP